MVILVVLERILGLETLENTEFLRRTVRVRVPSVALPKTLIFQGFFLFLDLKNGGTFGYF